MISSPGSLDSVFEWAGQNDAFVGWVQYNTPIAGTSQPYLTFKTNGATRGAEFRLADSAGNAKAYYGGSTSQEYVVNGTAWNTDGLWQRIKIQHCKLWTPQGVEILHWDEDAQSACANTPQVVPANWYASSGFYLGYSAYNTPTETSDLAVGCSGYAKSLLFDSTAKTKYSRVCAMTSRKSKFKKTIICLVGNFAVSFK